ncbi:RNA-directed DNA polymerase, eukaryota [Tanacetum coccineum]
MSSRWCRGSFDMVNEKRYDRGLSFKERLTNYHVEYEVSFTLLHCWDVLKECDKWKSEEVPLFMQKREEKMNKRYKSIGSSSFNTRESGEGMVNLNTTVGDEEDEVEEVRRPLPMAIFISRTTF